MERRAREYRMQKVASRGRNWWATSSGRGVTRVKRTTAGMVSLQEGEGECIQCTHVPVCYVLHATLYSVCTSYTTYCMYMHTYMCMYICRHMQRCSYAHTNTTTYVHAQMHSRTHTHPPGWRTETAHTLSQMRTISPWSIDSS